MEKEHFEHLIQQSGLHLDDTLSHLLHFMVSVQVERQFGTRYWHDTLAFGRDEFAAMTQEEAQFHIHACKARLDAVAQTKKSTILYYPAYLEQQKKPQSQDQPKTPVLATRKGVNYPAH